MNAQELKETFKRLYVKMSTSKDVEQMRLFGRAFAKVFEDLADKHPELAQDVIEMLRAIEWHNYVTAAEAMEIAVHFVNSDQGVTGAGEPSKGAHWSMDALKSFLEQRGLPLEDSPYYNWPTLWLVVNMMYSDFADVFVEVLGVENSEKMAVASYRMAVAKLKDVDRPRFVREYFDLNA